MANKKKTETIFVVVPAEATLVRKFFKDAEALAKEECSIGGKDMQIFEVVKSWYVQIPEEPEPEMVEDTLDEVLNLYE